MFLLKGRHYLLGILVEDLIEPLYLITEDAYFVLKLRDFAIGIREFPCCLSEGLVFFIELKHALLEY
jgi:hypothetical protein